VCQSQHRMSLSEGRIVQDLAAFVTRHVSCCTPGVGSTMQSSLFWTALALAAAAGVACTLNPQPLPPVEGNGGAGDFGSDGGRGGAASPASEALDSGAPTKKGDAATVVDAALEPPRTDDAGEAGASDAGADAARDAATDGAPDAASRD
jgi:hypothetical protein